VISDDAWRICLNALRIRECLLEALLVQRVHLDALLSDVYLCHAKRFEKKAGSFCTLLVETLLFDTLLFETLLLSTLLIFSAKLLFSFFFGLTGCLSGFLDFTCLLDIVSTLLRVIGKTGVTLDSRRRARFCRKASSLAFFWEI
jgi:hypothetical protein